jgi:hypothetical protein
LEVEVVAAVEVAETIPAEVEVAVMFISARSLSRNQLPSESMLVLAERLAAQIPRAETAKLLL